MTGKAVKEARRHLGLTQKELAELLDITRPTVSRWETRGCDRRGGLALAALLWVRGHPETARAFIWTQTEFPGFTDNGKNHHAESTA